MFLSFNHDKSEERKLKNLDKGCGVETAEPCVVVKVKRHHEK